MQTKKPVISYQDSVVIKTSDITITKATVILDFGTSIMQTKLIVTKYIDTMYVSASCDGVYVCSDVTLNENQNDELVLLDETILANIEQNLPKTNEICNICNVNEYFETNLSASRDPDILLNIAILIATEIGHAMSNGIEIKDISISSLFRNVFSLAKRRVVNKTIIEYGKATKTYAYVNKNYCIDKNRNVHEFIVTNCNGPLASELQLQLLYIPINKQYLISNTCVYLSLIDTESEGQDLYIGAEISTEDYQKLFCHFHGNAIKNEAIMNQIFNRFMKLVAVDLIANKIETLNDLLVNQKLLKQPDRYFREAVSYVAEKFVTEIA